MSVGKKKVFIMCGLCILVGTICLAFLCDFNDNSRVDKVVESYHNVVKSKQFSMYIKNSSDNTYEEYNDSELFPNSLWYSLNVIESYCIDNNENIIKEVLTYNNGKVTITSNKTLYCYLYFDGNIYDIETNILIKDGDSYKSVSKTPTTDDNYNYSVRYDCTNNDGIVSFGYDYTSHKYKLISSTKNKCDIYFEKMIPDIKVIIYINDKEVSEISTTNSYRLNETLSTCTNSDATISYNDTTKKVRIKSNKTTECNVYLEGA